MNDIELSVVIDKFLVLLEQFSHDSALLLAGCDKKIFDIGDEGFVYSCLSNELLHEVASLGFDINITIFPITDSDEQGVRHPILIIRIYQ